MVAETMPATSDAVPLLGKYNRGQAVKATWKPKKKENLTYFTSKKYAT